jgi:hypothetical protein
MFGYLRISQDISGYVQISFWGELPDVQSQIDGLKRAKVHEGHLLVRSTVQCPLGTCGTQGTVEDVLKTRIPHQAVPLQVKFGFDVQWFHRVWVVGVGCQ